LPKEFNFEDSKSTISISSNGFEFNYLKSSWKLNRNTTVNVGVIDKFDDELAEDLREILIFYAETLSGGYVVNLIASLSLYLKHCNETKFTEFGLHSLKIALPKKFEYKIAFLRSLIRQMRILSLDSNINEGVFELMGQWRLSAGERGVPVMSLDPFTGPFSMAEFEAIEFNSAHRYAEGKMSTNDYAKILLLKATGRRPEQIATLKIKDFSYARVISGPPIYVVSIPRIKQSNGGFRSTFRKFGLVNSSAQVIELYIKNVISQIEKALGKRLSVEERDELPLFFGGQTILLMKNAKDKLLDLLKTEIVHIPRAEFSRLVVLATNKLGIISERTGQLLHCNPYRFRYTLGTRAAIEGAGVLTIATLLDHSDTQHVDVYVANVPEYAIEISRIMNQPLARYASAFAGKLVKDEAEANNVIMGAPRIPFHEKDCDVGSCGTYSYCHDYAPVACYMCPKFMPWANAPHHLVLIWLLEERKRLQEYKKIDAAIICINDRAIIAVSQVIKLVEEYNNV
jgi:integrase